MSIISSNARWEDEDKAMQEFLDQQDAEMAEVYDNEVYPTPAQERLMEADMRWESAERHLDWLRALDPEDWADWWTQDVGLTLPEAIKQAEEEVAKAEALLRRTVAETADTSTTVTQQEPAQQTAQEAPESAPEVPGHWDPAAYLDEFLEHSKRSRE